MIAALALALPAAGLVAAEEPPASQQVEEPTPSQDAVGEGSRPSRGPEGWQRGFAFWGRSAPFGSPEGLRSLRHLRSLGADTVSPVITWYVDHPHDHRLRRGKGTPSDEDLVAAIDEAHRLGLRVVLRFHVDCEDGTWRAHIDPGDKEAWFAAYGAALNRYARLAEAHGVEGLVIGAELVGVTGPAHTQRWQSMIAEVRRHFSGFLTYSAQWGSAPAGSPADPYREFEQIGFWRELDYLGISAYFELAGDGQPSPPREELLARWEEWRSLQVEPFQALYDMPVLFTEVGYRSSQGAARHPWSWALAGGVDLQLQADLYHALFESWAGVPWFRGAYFWFWPTGADGSGPTDGDYPPTGKPAEQVVRHWYRILDDMESVPMQSPGAGGTILPEEGGDQDEREGGISARGRFRGAS